MTIPALKAQEFLLYDETFTWHADDDECGGYHYWYTYGNAPSMNWTSPYDYQSGLFYHRFEIIDQPSNAPFQLNFCIWAELAPDYSFWRESCATLSEVLTGPGSVSTFSGHVSPAWNDGIDWTDLTKLWRFGNPMWVNGHNMGNGPYCTDYPEEWASHELYFPLTLRVTIVAVPSGYTFSGWNNYIGGCTPAQQPTPSYNIDYSGESTSQVVPSTDEYSYNSNMSGAVDGNGSKLALTPGQDVYFRTKASGCHTVSAVQQLDVPQRPSPPSVSIDYPNERTAENIAGTLAYSASSSYTNPVSGTGGKVTLIPGQDLYFWVKPTTGSFASDAYHLTVPGRPATPTFSVDFDNEETNETVSAAYEYGTQADMSNAVTGSGSKITLIPGTDYYFRAKPTSSSFASGIFQLQLDERPVINTAAGDTVHNDFTIAVDFHHDVTGFDDSDIEATNAGVILTGALTAAISPVTDGDVTVKIIANAVNTGNFASDLFTTYYKIIQSSLPNNEETGRTMLAYPSPVEDVLHLQLERNLALPVEIKLINGSGAVVVYKELHVADYDVDMKDIPAGLYVLKAVDAAGHVIAVKIIKQHGLGP